MVSLRILCFVMRLLNLLLIIQLFSCKFYNLIIVDFFFILPVYFVLKYCRQIYMIFVRYLERLFLLYHIFSTFVWCEALNPSIRQVACLKKMINGQRKNAWIEFRYIPDVEFNFSMLMCFIIYVNEISNCLVFSF